MKDLLKRITLDEALTRVNEIKVLALTDDEAAHGRQEALYADVLHTIFITCEDPSLKALAGTALSTRKIGFKPW